MTNDMTIEEALDAKQRYSGPCACMGGERCCVRMLAKADEVLAGARVAADQISELLARRNEAAE